MTKPTSHHQTLTLAETLADYLAGATALGKGYDELAAQHAIEIADHPELAEGELVASVSDIKAHLAACYFGHQTLDETERGIRGMWKDLPPPREIVSDWTTQPEPQPWLIRDWLPQHELMLFTGAGGVGKSTLALQLAIALCLNERNWIPTFNPGAPYHLASTEPGDWTCHIAGYEDNRNQMLARTQRITDSPNLLTDRLFFSRERDGLWLSDRADEYGKPTDALKTLLDDSEPRDFLVIDPTAAAYAGNENDRGQVRAFLKYLAFWCEQTQTTLMLVAHPAKELSSVFSGSTDWRNAPRAFWSLTREDIFERDENGKPMKHDKIGEAVKLTLEKSSYGRPTPATPPQYLVGPYPKWEGTGDPEISARANQHRPE